MVITEKDIEQEETQDKPRRKNKIVKIVLTVIAIWIGIAVLNHLVDAYKEHSYAHGSKRDLSIPGFEDIKFGMGQNSAVEKMKAAGWGYRDIHYLQMVNENNGDVIVDTMVCVSFESTNNSPRFWDYEIERIGLFFDADDDARKLINFVFEIPFPRNNMEKFRQLMQKYVTELDFQSMTDAVQTNDGAERWYESSERNLCETHIFTRDSDTMILSVGYYARDFSKKMVNAYGGREVFIQQMHSHGQHD